MNRLHSQTLPKTVTFTKPLAVVALLCFSLLISSAAYAVKPVYSGGKERAAVRGYDVVAYFTVNEPVKGSSDFSFEHAGATWLFSSDANRKLFISNPEKYMPQYGGYCAYAVARDSTASSKPQYFTIHDDKLYLNYSKGVYKKWLKKKDDYIEDANANWPQILERE